MTDLAEAEANGSYSRETNVDVTRVTDWCCAGQLQAGISTLQRERGSEALARDQVHENKDCQSRNDADYIRDRETILLRNDRDICDRGF